MKQYKKVNGLYLYVEKSPEHGDPEFLLNYYKKYGYKEFLLGDEEDEDYYYMNKHYTDKSVSSKKTKSKTTSSSKKRRTTLKKAMTI